LIPVLAAFFVSIVVITLILRVGRAMPLDHPNYRSLHSSPIPRVGGIGVMCGVTVGWLLGNGLGLGGMLATALGLAAVSLIDDFRGLPVALRFAVQFAAAFLLVEIVLPAGSGVVASGVAIVAVVWAVNLYNFMDGSDGLAGGMALLGFGAFGVAAAMGQDWTLALAAWTVAAAAGGFLLFNFHPARVFLGDAGSVPLGFVAAALGLAGMVREIWPIWFPLLVFSPFIVDSTTTLFRRLLRGEKVWQAHHEHYYQRMVRSGIGHRDTALIWYAVMLASGLSACMALALPRTGQLAVLGGWAVFYAMAGAAVERRWSAYLSSVRDDRDGE